MTSDSRSSRSAATGPAGPADTRGKCSNAARTLVASAGLASLLGAIIPTAAADTATVHRHRGADGTMVFSDAPIGRDGLVRQSYRGHYGRPPATASCTGLARGDLEAQGRRWRPAVTAAATRHGLDPELVLAVVRVESCFDPRARSTAGALGLMQLMPGTARELGVANPFDPIANLEGGSRYLARMLARFDGDTRLALAAYNAGPGNVERHGGVPPFPETRRYVERIARLYGQAAP